MKPDDAGALPSLLATRRVPGCVLAVHPALRRTTTHRETRPSPPRARRETAQGTRKSGGAKTSALEHEQNVAQLVAQRRASQARRFVPFFSQDSSLLISLMCALPRALQVVRFVPPSFLLPPLPLWSVSRPCRPDGPARSPSPLRARRRLVRRARRVDGLAPRVILFPIFAFAPAKLRPSSRSPTSSPAPRTRCFA